MHHQKFDAGDRAFAAHLFDEVRAMSATREGVTREGYSDKEASVLEFLTAEGRKLGLEPETDAAGNVWLVKPGRDRSLPAFVAGSHVDSVPEGGNFDGLAGVVAGLVCAHHWHAAGVEFERDYRVLMLRCEESSFYGKAYVGSLGMMGRLGGKEFALKHRTTGGTLGEALRSQGVDPAAVSTGRPVIDVDKIAAFVELHIEQGPMLDASETVRTGLVTGIRGNIRHKAVKCLGVAAHSGAVDKAYRHDALMATAELVHRMEERWQERLDAGDDLVFTVGVLKLADTAAISVIPGEVTFSVDMRSLSLETCRAFEAEMREAAGEIAARRGVSFEFDAPLVTEPGLVSKAVFERLEKAAADEGVPVRAMASGAGHDTAVLSAAGIPAAMIFVANQNGSHNPREAMKLDDFMTGAEVLRRAVENFDLA